MMLCLFAGCVEEEAGGPGENPYGLTTVKEGYTADVILNGVAKAENRFSYYAFDGGNGWFRFELGTVEELSTNGVSFTMNATIMIKDATGKVICYANFEGLKYSTLSYEADADNPGYDALVVTPISGPAAGENEGFEKLFDNKTTTKLCKSDRTPVVFSLAEAKALGGISLVTANDNQSYTGRIVTGFTLYGGSSADAIDNVVLAVTEAGMADVNFTEYYYAIADATAYQYYKIVFDGTNTFQFSELWVYEAGASAPVEFDGKLPTTGITQLKVVEYASDSNLSNWGDGKDEYLFDGGYGITQVGGTKIGGGVANGGFTMTFSLEAPATVSYYTFITGRDSNGARNPKSWTLYGKNAAGEWVVIDTVDEETATATMGKTNSRAYNYKTANPGEYKDYKIEFATEGMFQMDEMILFADDATAGTNKLSLVGGMEYVPFHTRGDFNAETYEFRLTCKAEGGHFSQETIAKTTAEGAYVYLKDITNGGEYVKYEIATLRTERWCDFFITLDGFTPVAGVEYEVVFVFVGAEGSKCAGDLHYMTTTGLKIAQ